MQHGTAVNENQVEELYGTVSSNAVLAKHNASTGGPAERNIYFENRNYTLRDASFNNIGIPGVWLDDQTLDTAFNALERAFRCGDHRIALFNMGFAFQLYQYTYNYTYKLGTDMEKLAEKAENKDSIIILVSDG
jgi:hypothetical protein